LFNFFNRNKTSKEEATKHRTSSSSSSKKMIKMFDHLPDFYSSITTNYDHSSHSSHHSHSGHSTSDPISSDGGDDSGD
jgi:hypothetical protein